MVFLKFFSKKVDFEKNQQMTKSMKYYPGYKELTCLSTSVNGVNLDLYVVMYVAMIYMSACVVLSGHETIPGNPSISNDL